MVRKLLLVGALAVLFALYAWGQNVGETPRVLVRAYERLYLACYDSVTVLVMLATGGAIGRRLLMRLAWTGLTRPERIALEAALGWGVLAALLLLIGLVGWFEVFTFALLWLPLLFLFGRAGVAWSVDALRVARRVWYVDTAWERLLLGVVVVWLLTSALVALAPPTAWDGMTYHLVAPARYLQERGVRAHADNFFMGFPQAAEMLFSVPMALGRDHPPALLHWSAGVLGLLIVGGALYRHANRATGLAAAVFLLTGASTWRLFGAPYVDLFMLLYGAGALVSLQQWRDGRSTGWLLLAGALCGVAVSVKYTGALLAIACALLVLLTDKRGALRNLARLTLSAGAAFALWGVKGALLYGNPFYPYGGGLAWDSIRAATFNMAGEGFLANPAYLWQLPLLPFTATVFGVEQAAPYSYSAGVWLLTAPFLLLWGWRGLNASQRELACTAGVVAGVFWAAWVLLAATSGIGAQPRLLLAGAPAALILGSLGLYGVSRLPKRMLNVFFIVQALVLLSALLAGVLLVNTFTRGGAVRYLVGDMTQHEYLTRNLGVYADMTYQLYTLPRGGSRVLFLWEPMSYYCPQFLRCVGDVLHDHWEHPLQTGSAPQDVFAAWRAQGIDYVLVNGLGGRADVGYRFWLKMRPATAAYNALFPAALDDAMTQIWTDNITYRLYTWKD